MLACSMQTRSGGLFDTSHKIAALNFLSGKQKNKKKKNTPIQVQPVISTKMRLFS